MATSTKRPAAANTKGQGAGEIAFGIILVVLGAIVLAAVSNPLEIAVWLGGPIIALLGFAFAIRAIARRAGVQAIWFGLMAFLLGGLLGIHDFLFPPGIAALVHLAIGIAILVLGILQLAAKKRYMARWLPAKRTA